MTATETPVAVKTPRTRKPRTAAFSGVAPVAIKTPKAEQVALKRWANAGIWMTLVMSALLNGYSNAQNTRENMEWAGWLMGLATPALVLIFSRVSSLQYRMKRYKRAGFTASVSIGLLLLSALHCAESIAMLTGSHLWLAVPMAIAIDCGLVACELAEVMDS